MILLANCEHEIREAIRDGLLSFEREHSAVRWAFLGLDATVPFGSIAINFDTKEHNAAVQRAYPNAASFSAKAVDEGGCYNNNCVSFAFPAWREVKREDWSSEYFDREGRSLVVIYPDGQSIEIPYGCGDEKVNEAIFPFLVATLVDEARFILDASRNRDAFCRIGVQMCDSNFVDFWKIDARQSASPKLSPNRTPERHCGVNQTFPAGAGWLRC